MFSPSSPITGGAQTNLTNPTYSFVSDVAPDDNGKQYAITSLGGTQTGVTTHSVSSPFTFTGIRPRVLQGLGVPNPVTGIIARIPRNVWTYLTRKGVTPLAGQPICNLLIETKVSVPAGADLADPANIRAALSAHIGLLNQVSAGVGDSAVLGIL